MNKKQNIIFNCYVTSFDDVGETTLFLFWPNGKWDENKLLIDEALKKYPITIYNWIKAEEDKV